MISFWNLIVENLYWKNIKDKLYIFLYICTNVYISWFTHPITRHFHYRTHSVPDHDTRLQSGASCHYPSRDEFLGILMNWTKLFRRKTPLFITIVWFSSTRFRGKKKIVSMFLIISENLFFPIVSLPWCIVCIRSHALIN